MPTWGMRIAIIVLYSAACTDLAAELDMSYLSFFEDFPASEGFVLAVADRVHHVIDGSTMIADAVAGWGTWRVHAS
jgi:hypothetical protein